MKVILLESFKKLGSEGDVVNVADGYARNYLIPREIAIEHSFANTKVFEHQKKHKQRLESLEREKAAEIADKLAALKLSITMKAGDSNQLFGSVTNQDIADLLLKDGFEIDKRKIEISEPIKTLGTYTIHISLHHEIKASVQLWVNKES